MPLPYTIRRIKYRGRPAELMTFTGRTQEEFDVFLDARFAEGREPIGPRTDGNAPMGHLYDAAGKLPGLCWFQYRRYVIE